MSNGLKVVVVVSVVVGEAEVDVGACVTFLKGGKPLFLKEPNLCFFVNLLLTSLFSLRLCECSASVGGLVGLGYLPGSSDDCG